MEDTLVINEDDDFDLELVVPCEIDLEQVDSFYMNDNPDLQKYAKSESDHAGSPPANVEN